MAEILWRCSRPPWNARGTSTHRSSLSGNHSICIQAWKLISRSRAAVQPWAIPDLTDFLRSVCLLLSGIPLLHWVGLTSCVQYFVCTAADNRSPRSRAEDSTGYFLSTTTVTSGRAPYFLGDCACTAFVQTYWPSFANRRSQCILKAVRYQSGMLFILSALCMTSCHSR